MGPKRDVGDPPFLAQRQGDALRLGDGAVADQDRLDAVGADRSAGGEKKLARNSRGSLPTSFTLPGSRL